MREELSEAELSCYLTIEAFLVNVARGSDSGSVGNDVDDVREQADPEAEGENTPEKKSWRPIEDYMSSARLHQIYEHYKSKGRASCMKKFKISKSQVTSAIRNGEKGDGEHVKSAKIRKFMLEKFTQVEISEWLPCSTLIAL